jgi:hypothetical protein
MDRCRRRGVAGEFTDRDKIRFEKRLRIARVFREGIQIIVLYTE